MKVKERKNERERERESEREKKRELLVVARHKRCRK
jgi:hypothetical protein